MMWPFIWKLFACTYKWCYVFFKISQNKIGKFGRNLLLAKFSSERVNQKMDARTWKTRLARERKIDSSRSPGCSDFIGLTGLWQASIKMKTKGGSARRVKWVVKHRFIRTTCLLALYILAPCWNPESTNYFWQSRDVLQIYDIKIGA